MGKQHGSGSRDIPLGDDSGAPGVYVEPWQGMWVPKGTPKEIVDRLARGLARIAAAHYPKPVIVRMSDFKTNEYADLIGGARAAACEYEADARFRRPVTGVHDP